MIGKIRYWIRSKVGFIDLTIHWVIYLAKNLRRGKTLAEWYGLDKAVDILLGEYLGPNDELIWENMEKYNL